MTAKAYCSNCGAALRADDRFCARCGDTANADTPAGAHLQEFRPKDGPLQRVGDFAVEHAKGLLALVAIGALVGIGLLVGQETSVPESASSPGLQDPAHPLCNAAAARLSAPANRQFQSVPSGPIP